jgi:5-hydroxyisourate hydrolase
MAGRLTTHALDTVAGRGAAGLTVRLERLTPGRERMTTMRLDENGRAVLLDGALVPGVYELEFAVGEYHRARGIALAEPAFFDAVVVRFGVADGEAHYHVPLVFSPHSYSTYRGT